jgi:hypothetical protein
MLKIENEIFYIFKYMHTKKEPLQMKIRYPIGEYYDSLSINEYTAHFIKIYIISQKFIIF